MEMLNPSVVLIAEELGWRVTEYEDNTVTFEQYSPAGEDFFITVGIEHIEKELRDYLNNFDVDEHVEMLVVARRNGVSGIPSVSELLEDAKEIYKMIQGLSDAISMYFYTKNIIKKGRE